MGQHNTNNFNWLNNHNQLTPSVLIISHCHCLLRLGHWAFSAFNTGLGHTPIGLSVNYRLGSMFLLGWSVRFNYRPSGSVCLSTVFNQLSGHNNFHTSHVCPSINTTPIGHPSVRLGHHCWVGQLNTVYRPSVRCPPGSIVHWPGSLAWVNTTGHCPPGFQFRLRPSGLGPSAWAVWSVSGLGLRLPGPLVWLILSGHWVTAVCGWAVWPGSLSVCQ